VKPLKQHLGHSVAIQYPNNPERTPKNPSNTEKTQKTTPKQQNRNKPATSHGKRKNLKPLISGHHYRPKNHGARGGFEPT